MKVIIERSNQYVKNRRIATGDNIPQKIEVDINPADLAECTRKIIIDIFQYYRDKLDGIPYYGSDYTITLTSTTVMPFRLDAEPENITTDNIDQLIQVAFSELNQKHSAYEAEKAEKAEQAAIEKEEKQKQQSVEIDRFLSDSDARAVEIGNDYIFIKSRKESIKSDHPLFTELKKTAVKRAQEYKTKQEEIALQQAINRAQQLNQWIMDYGTDGQKKRHARGLLSEEEVIKAIREQAFSPLADLPRYKRITNDEVRESYGYHLDDDYCYSETKFLVQSANKATDEQFALIEQIENLLSNAQTEFRIHYGYLKNTTEEEDEKAQVIRYSIKVTIQVGELTLTREYAA